MLRLHRHRHQPKSGDKVDFKFSGFKALQVPKGWDKLVVSFVSVETGKTVAKTSKATVRNGSCQWAETLSESIRVSEEDSAKEIEDRLFRLIVSMGSARSGVLGEATINMKDYMSTSDSVPVSLSLKKCTHGTILQVKIQCMTPRAKSRDVDLKEKNMDSEKSNGDHQDIDIKSDGSGSDSTVTRSLTSSSTNGFRLNSNPGELGSRETSFSLSESHQSYDSAEGSIGGEDVSVGDHGSDVQSLVRRADSLGSENSVSPESCLAEIHHSKHTSFNSQVSGSGNQSENYVQEFPASLLSSASSVKNFREASEGTVEELRAEAKMWERNARKLMLDLDVLKAEFSDKSKIQENLSVELSAACAERDDLKREVERLKLSSEKSMVKQTSLEDLTRDDLRFQKESNADLAMQLKRSHESNVELVSVLQELEETVERQKMEIQNLLAAQSKFSDVEKTAEANSEDNRKLRDRLREMEDFEKDLSFKVKLLEQALEEKNQQIEKGKILNSQAFFDVETEYKSKVLEKEVEIVKLKEMLLGSLEVRSTNGSDVDPIREIEELKEKVQELERDCNELTEENLDLLFKLKAANNEPMRMSTSVEFPHRTSFEFQLGKQKSPPSFVAETTTNEDRVSVQELHSLNIELEAKLAEMDKELAEKRSGVEKLHLKLRSNEEEISVLKQSRSELDAIVSELRKEKAQLQDHLEVVLQESDITSKCLNDLQNDLAVLTSSVDSHSSANKVLERKSSELETGYRELELHTSELERENLQLSDLVASLEARLRELTVELESSHLELENSKSDTINLKDEIDRLRIEMQSTVESLIQECNSLHKSNEELRDEKLELRVRCSLLETKLEESQKSLTDCSKKVDDLEKYLSSALAEFASKEKSLTSEIDTLVDENLKHKEKFSQEESLLNQMYMEKVVEVENLQQEVEHLIRRLSETHEETERIDSDSIEELSRLRADNEKLEAELEVVQSKMKQTESEFNNKEMDYEVKLKRLSSELAATKQDHEKLSKLLEDYKSGEAKLKTAVSDLELKLTVSEFQRQQLSEECSYLKVELKKLARLENELGETKVEKEKLEAFVHAMSEECRDLKAEKNELSKKMSVLKALVSELEGYRSEKLALEEKLLQMEDDLVEKEVLRVRDSELKKELSLVRKENRQYEQKIEQLQEERDESQRRSQAIEEELKLVREEKQNTREQPSGRKASNFSKTNTKVNPVLETAKIPKNEMAKSANQRRDSQRNRSQKENGGVCESPDGSPRNIGDTGSKIQLLEDQLTKALEENSKYKAQLNKFLSENRKGHVDSLRKSTPEAEVVPKAKYERTKSSLEAELRDIRERYSSMSLKYAEVEAQREELVMKLKTVKTGKRWFS